MGSNAVVPALAPVASGWVVSVVEFPGLDLGVLRQQQDDASVPTRVALTAPLVEALQDSYVIGVDPGSAELWRAPVPQPVVGLVTLDDGPVASLDVDGSLVVRDPADGSILDTSDDVVSAATWQLTGKGSDLLVGAFDVFRRVRWIGGRLEADDQQRLGVLPAVTDDLVVFADLTGRLRLADVDALDDAEPFGNSPTYTNGAWLLPESDYLIEATGGGDV